MPKEFFIEQPTPAEVRLKIEELEKYPNLKPRLATTWPMTREKEQLLELVNANWRKLRKKENKQKIKKLEQSKDFLDQETANYLKFKIEKHIKKTKISPKLLSTRKPLFATLNIPQLSEKIGKLEEISKTLQEKYKDKFIGFTVFGSTSKGYSEKESDIDYALFGSKPDNKELFGDFHKLAGKHELNLCYGVGSYLGSKDKYWEFGNKNIKISRLFKGIFFGNRKQLIRFQKEVLNKVTEKDWDETRDFIMEQETRLGKAALRLNINDKERTQVQANIKILRTPPPLQEARQIINKRYKQEFKK